MNIQRNWILQRLGITLWKLRYPIIFKNKKSIQLWTHIRLLLISDIPTSLNDVFINDVIRAMRISPQEVYVLTVDQIKNLILPTKKDFSYHCWWIGVEVLRDFNGISLHTPSLSILKCSIKDKRDLWYQIDNSISKYYIN